jgi:hypothetical protein
VKQLERLRGKARSGDPVFPSRKKGKPLTESGIWRIVKRAGKRAGLEASVSPHWLMIPFLSQPGLDRVADLQGPGYELGTGGRPPVCGIRSTAVRQSGLLEGIPIATQELS